MMPDHGTRDEAGPTKDSKWISVDNQLPPDAKLVDLWMEIIPSIRSMGFADSFCVPVCWRRGGKWYHSYKGREAELDAEYVTHWTENR